MTTPFLTLTDVCKGYGSAKQRTEVLHNINLEVRRGEFLAIVGYSGAGKTTLISMIAGLISPDSGRIELDGKQITGRDRIAAWSFSRRRCSPGAVRLTT